MPAAYAAVFQEWLLKVKGHLRELWVINLFLRKGNELGRHIESVADKL